MKNAEPLLLSTLREWTQLTPTDDVVVTQDHDPDARKLLSLATSNKGQAQRLPSSLLMPV